MPNAFFLHSLSPSPGSQNPVIAQLDKAQADGFIKGIQEIISHCNPIRFSIKNSIVTHWYSDSSGIVSVDFRSLLESDVSLSFISDHSLMRSLSSLTNGSDLVISESASGHKYRLIADKSEVCLSKIDGHRVKHPDLSDLANGSIGSSIEIGDTRPLQINAKAGPRSAPNVWGAIIIGNIHQWTHLPFQQNNSLRSPRPARPYIPFLFIHAIHWT
jgi:hypothetical protein